MTNQDIVDFVRDCLIVSPEVDHDTLRAVHDRLTVGAGAGDLRANDYDAVAFALEAAGVPREDTLAICDELRKGRHLAGRVADHDYHTWARDELETELAALEAAYDAADAAGAADRTLEHLTDLQMLVVRELEGRR